MTEYISAWQCASCGKVDGPQPCAGICQYEAVNLVRATDYDEKCAQLDVVQAKLASIMNLLRQLAHTRPHDGQWQRAYGEAQQKAVNVLAAHDQSALRC